MGLEVLFPEELPILRFAAYERFFFLAEQSIENSSGLPPKRRLIKRHSSFSFGVFRKHPVFPSFIAPSFPPQVAKDVGAVSGLPRRPRRLSSSRAALLQAPCNYFPETPPPFGKEACYPCFFSQATARREVTESETGAALFSFYKLRSFYCVPCLFGNVFRSLLKRFLHSTPDGRRNLLLFSLLLSLSTRGAPRGTLLSLTGAFSPF